MSDFVDILHSDVRSMNVQSLCLHLMWKKWVISSSSQPSAQSSCLNRTNPYNFSELVRIRSIYWSNNQLISLSDCIWSRPNTIH